MKQLRTIIGLIVLVSFALDYPSSLFAQGKPRPSLKATTMQRLGTDVDITIVYSRPGVKGRKIWGGLEPYGMHEGNQYSNNKPFPWRAGANENTTIEFNKDLMVEGKKLAAGKYGIHMIPSEKDWVVIFSKTNDIWGSFAYDEANDAIRVTVTPVEAAHQEWLMYGFENLAGNSGTAYLHWDKLKIPVKMEVAGE